MCFVYQRKTANTQIVKAINTSVTLQINYKGMMTVVMHASALLVTVPCRAYQKGDHIRGHLQPDVPVAAQAATNLSSCGGSADCSHCLSRSVTIHMYRHIFVSMLMWTWAVLHNSVICKAALQPLHWNSVIRTTLIGMCLAIRKQANAIRQVSRLL